MCGLFGFYHYGNKARNYSQLLNALADGATERGTHATGIAYNMNNHLTVYKRPLPAWKMYFTHGRNVRAVMGHTRHATQGDVHKNYNNHPFSGTAGETAFAMAHNGIIYNDDDLRWNEKLPLSHIKTDSYIYAQLLENENELTFDSIARATEKLQGYYTFTILNDFDQLYIVKGDSPLSLVHIPELELYIYASTDKILYEAITVDDRIQRYITAKSYNEIKLTDGDIVRINTDGSIDNGQFTAQDSWSYNWKNWYDYLDTDEDELDSSYYNEVLQVAQARGYTAEDIDELLTEGLTLDEIADWIYEGVSYC